MAERTDTRLPNEELLLTNLFGGSIQSGMGPCLSDQSCHHLIAGSSFRPVFN